MHRSRDGQTNNAYMQVAIEFGVQVEAIRQICGLIGAQTAQRLTYAQRVALLRAKLDAYGLAPMVRKPLPRVKETDHDEPRELRTCILCKNFLEDDDPGGDVVNSEDCEQHAIICKSCVEAREQI